MHDKTIHLINFSNMSLPYSRPWVAEPFQSGGHKYTSKQLQENFAVWIGNCDVTSTEIWRHYL